MYIIYPENIECAFCKEPIPIANPYSLCKKCFNKIELLENSKTRYDEAIIKLKEEKYRNKKIIDDIFIIFKYDDIIKTLIHRFKYRNETYLAKIFADMIETYIKNQNIEFDYIIPVPVHEKRLKSRGYNQIELILKILKKKYKYIIYDKVKRIKNTPDMYHLDKEERLRIMKESFLAQEDEELKGKKVLIIDDVLTTGSTIFNLSKEIIRKNMDTNIYCLVISRPSKK